MAKFMHGGMPDWNRFHQAVGGLIAELRLQYRGARLRRDGGRALAARPARSGDPARGILERPGEAADLLAVLRLSLDNRDADAYGGAFECVCKVHTHLIPARDYEAFNDAVSDASKAFSTSRLRRCSSRCRRASGS